MFGAHSKYFSSNINIKCCNKRRYDIMCGWNGVLHRPNITFWCARWRWDRITVTSCLDAYFSVTRKIHTWMRTADVEEKFSCIHPQSTIIAAPRSRRGQNEEWMRRKHISRICYYDILMTHECLMCAFGNFTAWVNGSRNQGAWQRFFFASTMTLPVRWMRICSLMFLCMLPTGWVGKWVKCSFHHQVRCGSLCF